MRESNVTVTKVTSDANSTVDASHETHLKFHPQETQPCQQSEKILNDAFPEPESNSNSDDAPGTKRFQHQSKIATKGERISYREKKETIPTVLH